MSCTKLPYYARGQLQGQAFGLGTTEDEWQYRPRTWTFERAALPAKYGMCAAEGSSLLIAPTKVEVMTIRTWITP